MVALLLCAVPLDRSEELPLGQAALRQLLLENRALSRQVAVVNAAAEREGLAQRYAEVRRGKEDLLRRLEELEAAPELEPTRAAARSAIQAEVRLLGLLAERARLEKALGDARQVYLAAVSRARGVPTRVEPRDSTRYLERPGVREALEQRRELERRVREVGPVIDELLVEVRARHARADDLAFSRGLVPYRTAPPY